MFFIKTMVAFLAYTVSVASEENNRVESFSSEITEENIFFHIETLLEPKYISYQLKSPNRLVLDISDAKLNSNVQGLEKVDDTVDHVEIQELPSSGSTVVRITLFTNKNVDGSVDKKGNKIIWKIKKESVQKNDHASIKGIKKREDNKWFIESSLKTSFEVQNLENPKRMALDIFDAEFLNEKEFQNFKDKKIKKVRTSKHDGYVRIVFDLNQNNTFPKVVQKEKNIEITFEIPKKKKKQIEELPWTDVATISDIQYQIVDHQTSKIIVHMSGDKESVNAVDFSLDQSNENDWVVECTGSRIPKFLQRILDASSLNTVVNSIASVEEKADPPMVRIHVSLFGKASGKLEKRRGVWNVIIKDQRIFEEKGKNVHVSGYYKNVNVDLREADLLGVIRLISDISGENIITSDSVRGKISMRLNNVPWDKALDAVLKSKGFDRVRDGNIWRVSTIDEITKEKEAEARKKNADQASADMTLHMLPVNYAVAAEVMDQIKPLLSSRGSVQQDVRTNTLILQDLPSRIKEIVSLAKKLDKQTPQVLIEARIVEAQSNHLQDLGVQWGGIGQASANTGNPTGLSFPGDVVAQGAADDATRNQSGGNTSPSRYAVNLPATVGSGMGGGIGFIFGAANGSQVLNLRLTAMEANGDGRIISSPRVTTLDNKTAKIAQGIDIPISVVSAAGANTRFISANLELEVTPHVTNEGSIMLKIKTSKNEPDFTQRGAAGDPTIVKKFAETEVLVGDGETTVIGGIFTRATTETFAEVPYLSKIPVLGWLFKSRRKEDKRAELLVFISPRIVNRRESLPNQALGAVDRNPSVVYESVSP
jgi:type IV pilus assembly protein PilQ